MLQRESGPRQRWSPRTLAVAREVFDLATDAIVVTDASSLDEPDGPLIVYANDAFVALTGYRRDELLGRTPRLLQGLHTDAQKRAELKEALCAGRSAVVELRNYRKDGSEYVVEMSVAPLDPGGGVVTHHLGVARDVTARYENAARMRAIVEHSSDLVCVADASGRVVWVGPSVERILGYSPAELVGADTTGLIHVDDRERIAGAYAECLASSGTHAPVETRFRHADGRWRRIEVVHTNLLADPDVRGVVVNGRDVTEERSAVERVRASEERLRALVENVSDIITVIDREGTVRFSSPSASRVLGYPSGWWPGGKILDLLHPDDVPAAVEAFRGVHRRHPTTTLELRVRHADGTWRHLEAHAGELLDDPHLEGFVVTSRDVTERRRMEDILVAQASVTQTVASGAPLEDTLRQLTGILEHHVQGARCAISCLTPGARHLEVAAAPSMSEDYAAAVSALPMRPDAAPLTAAVLTGGEVVVPDLDDASGWTDMDWHERQGIRACWAVPIRAADSGDVVGCLTVHWATPRAPTDGDRRLVLASAHLAGIAIEREAVHRALEHAASHDDLTDLPNRTMMLDHLRTLLRSRRDRRVAVLFCDLDRFKLINDSLGHEVGDRVLADVARRIPRCLRQSDVVARFGGDEYVIVLDDVGRAAAEEIARRIGDELRTPVTVDDLRLGLTASIGVYLARRDDEPTDVLRRADIAMYTAKREGRNRYAFYDSRAMGGRASAAVRTESDLRDALDGDELTVAFQPIVDVTDMTTVAVEALVRWEHPRRGLLLPGEFLPVAEEAGLMEALGERVLRLAASHVRSTDERRSPGARPLQLSVNVSGQQFAGRRALADVVAEVLEATALDPGRLTIEVTEGVLGASEAATVSALRRLRRTGVRIAIDDFGVGYSSLSRLRNLPVDVLKIDRSFTVPLGAGRQPAALLHAVTRLAEALQLTVVVEGVETPAQLDAIGRLGCRYAQGFLLARPLSPSGLDDLVAAGGRCGGAGAADPS